LIADARAGRQIKG